MNARECTSTVHVLEELALHRPIAFITKFCRKCLAKTHFVPKRPAGRLNDLLDSARLRSGIR